MSQVTESLSAFDLPAVHTVRPAQTHRSRPLLLDLRVLMVGLTGFCVFLNVYATQTLLPLLAKTFSASKFHVSLTVSATTIGIALAAPFIGILAQRLGTRRTMVLSSLLLVGPILVAATSPNLNTLIGWRFLQGLVMPGIIAVTMAYIAEEWHGPTAATVMAVYVAGNVLGGVIGRFLSGLVADHLGWRMSFVVLGAISLAGALAIAKWLPHPSELHRPVRLKDALRDMTAHLRNPSLLATFVAGMASLFALVGTFTYITFYLAAPPFNLGTVSLGSMFGVYLVGVVVTPFAGPWIGRIGHRPAFAYSALISAAGVSLTLVHWLPAVVIGLALASTGVFVCQSAAASFLGVAAKHGKASAAGLYSTFYYVGGTLGAAVPALAWAWGGWFACVLMITLVLAAGAGVALRYWNGRRIVQVEPVVAID